MPTGKRFCGVNLSIMKRLQTMQKALYGWWQMVLKSMVERGIYKKTKKVILFIKNCAVHT
jgi:hypothetical protein